MCNYFNILLSIINYRCQECAPGYFGDALAIPKGDCKPCECNPLGAIPSADNGFVCEQPTGQCPCKDNVIGRQW